MNPLRFRDLIRQALDWKIGAIFLLFLAVTLPALNDIFIYIPDSARYLVWAESLADFQGLTDASGPDPIRYVVHAPLYALILAPAAILFPGSAAAAKFLTILFGLGLLFMVYAYLSEHAGKIPAVVGILVLSLNPLQVLYSAQILSDVPFAALLLLLLILIDRLVQQPVQMNGSHILFALLLSAAVLLREVGIALLAACAVLFVTRKEYRRAAVVVLIPLAFYALWLLRNEVIVAGMERPPLRNSELFAAHLYTVREAPLISELLARAASNVRIYAGMAGKLLLFTQYDIRGYGIIPPTESLFGWLMVHARFLFLPASLLTAGLFALGLWHGCQQRASARVAFFFLLFYLPLILVYPFNDIRFLFPLLILVLLFGVSGAVILVRKVVGGNPVPKGVAAGGVLCLLLLIVPNGAWVSSYVSNTIRYGADPDQYYQSVVDRPDAPELLMFPMSKIGEWICRNTEPTAVVATRWKQLSFWLEGRKVLELNPMLPVDLLENQIRDYQVGYLVALLDRSRLREFETQMALASRFMFVPVHRIGNAVIIRIVPLRESAKSPFPPAAPAGERWLDSLDREDGQLQYLFRDGLQSMDRGRPEEAETSFESLSTRAGRSGTVVLHTAIARSFAGKFGEAEELLRNVREGQQAGPLLVHSSYHLQIIGKLRQAEAARDSSERADILTRVAGDYWSLGFKLQAERILKRAIEADPAFPPTLVFGIYFDLLRRDTVSARARLRHLRSVALSHPSVQSFSRLLEAAEAASKERNLAGALAHREVVAQSYQQLGLTESAIDELTEIISLDPFRLTALQSLARIYVERERYAPAKRILGRLAEIAPSDPLFDDLKRRFENRWGD